MGDTTWGKGDMNRWFREHLGLHRLALHAAEVAVTCPRTGERLRWDRAPARRVGAGCPRAVSGAQVDVRLVSRYGKGFGMPKSVAYPRSSVTMPRRMLMGMPERAPWGCRRPDFTSR